MRDGIEHVDSIAQIPHGGITRCLVPTPGRGVGMMEAAARAAATRATGWQRGSSRRLAAGGVPNNATRTDATRDRVGAEHAGSDRERPHSGGSRRIRVAAARGLDAAATGGRVADTAGPFEDAAGEHAATTTGRRAGANSPDGGGSSRLSRRWWGRRQ